MHSALEGVLDALTRLQELHPRVFWRFYFSSQLVTLEGNLGLMRKDRVWSWDSLRLARVPEMHIMDTARAICAALEEQEREEIAKAAQPRR
jgi:hypothetical protein